MRQPYQKEDYFTNINGENLGLSKEPVHSKDIRKTQHITTKVIAISRQNQVFGGTSSGE
jgi:hypothetical protein